MLKIPYARQSISQTDIKKVNLTLKSNFLTTGPKTLEFENKLSEYSGAKFSIALNSATSASSYIMSFFRIKKMIIYGQRQFHLQLHQIVLILWC